MPNSTATLTPPATHVTVGLVAVELPDDGPALTFTPLDWLDKPAAMVGYDPRVIDETIVALWLDRKFPAGYKLVDGVPE